MASYHVILIAAFIATAAAALYNEKELAPEDDPCYAYKCKKPVGSMCVVIEKGDRLKASCVCPETCPTEVSPVCSVYGKQYDNKCMLYKTACEKKRAIPMAYEGECVASQLPCSQSELEQFPLRLLEWFLHLKEINEFGVLNPKNNIRIISVEEREEIAQWKFDILDRKHNDFLDRRDLRDFRYALMPLEHCADSFFKMCDGGDNIITLEEWIQCLRVNDVPSGQKRPVPFKNGKIPDIPDGEPEDDEE